MLCQAPAFLVLAPAYYPGLEAGELEADHISEEVVQRDESRQTHSCLTLTGGGILRNQATAAVHK